MTKETVTIKKSDYEMLYKLARRTIWIAYNWNDHNFGHPHDIAREECENLDLFSFDSGNGFLENLPEPGECSIYQQVMHKVEIGGIEQLRDELILGPGTERENEMFRDLEEMIHSISNEYHPVDSEIVEAIEANFLELYF